MTEVEPTAAIHQPSSGRGRQTDVSSALLWQPRGLFGKFRWHANVQVTRRPWLLNALGATLTVVDVYGAPGDTLLTAIVCRHLRQRYTRLRLNCVTPNPELLRHDPSVDTVNEPETFFSVQSWYPDLVGRRDGATNVLRETFDRLGLRKLSYDYRAEVHLSAIERQCGLELLGRTAKPVLTFHTRSANRVKDWPLDRWLAVLGVLHDRFHLVHLGDAREPEIDGVLRLAGQLTLRESMAVLSHARVHIGADSFLMHAANGLNVPAVIIFGGSRTPANLGYAANINLYVPMPCGPCWIHPSLGEECRHDLACMREIRSADVVSAADAILARTDLWPPGRAARPSVAPEAAG